MLEFEGVGIDTLTTSRHRLAHKGDALLESRAAAMEDAYPSPGLGPREEGQMCGKAFVIPSVGTGFVHPGSEGFLAISGEGVHDPSPLRA